MNINEDEMLDFVGFRDHNMRKQHLKMLWILF